MRRKEGRKEKKEGSRGEKVDETHDAVWDNGDFFSVVVRVRKRRERGGESVDKEDKFSGVKAYSEGIG